MIEERVLHAHQDKAIADLRMAIMEGSRRPMLMAPTGFGKTVVACRIVQSAVEKGKRVMFTVPAIDLVDQTARDFFGQGVCDIGVMQANHELTNPRRRVQIASLATLRNRFVHDDNIPDLCLVDEAHRRDENLRKLMKNERWKKTLFVGLSATPWSKGLGEDYDCLIIATTTAELITKGFLSPFRVFAYGHPDLKGVKTVATEYGMDYQQSQLSEAMQKGALVGDIVETWLRHGDHRPTLAFCVDRGHAQAVQAAFLAAGANCAYQDANTPREERKAIRRGFHDGTYPVVANIGTLTTGVDWDVRCIIYARPTKSEILYVQIIGRGLRTAEGKDDCLIFDHSDTTTRLGFVTEIHHTELDDGKTRAKAKSDDTGLPLAKECPKCHALRPPRSRACPSCGFVPQPKDAVETVNGDLVEITRGRKKKPEPTWDEKIAFIGELRAYQMQRGMSDGWVAWRYKAKFGMWPNDPQVRHARAAPAVSEATASWIRSQNIRYAKEQEKQRGHQAAV